MGSNTSSPAAKSLSDLLQEFVLALKSLWNGLSNEDRGSAVKQILDVLAGLAHEDKASEGPVLDHLAEFLAERLRVDREAARGAAATLCETREAASSSKPASTSPGAERSEAAEEILRRARELLLLVRVHYEVKKPLHSYVRRLEIFFEPDEKERLEDDRPSMLAYHDDVDWLDLPTNARESMIAERDRPVAYDIYRRAEVRS